MTIKLYINTAADNKHYPYQITDTQQDTESEDRKKWRPNMCLNQDELYLLYHLIGNLLTPQQKQNPPW